MFRLFGLWIAFRRNFCGNCFSPALVFVWRGVKERVSSHAPIPQERLSSLNVELQGRLLRRREERLAKPEEFSYPAWLEVTVRTKSGRETVIYWRGWFRFDWNSEHLAFRFGRVSEQDFGNVYQWRNHLYL
jgi:hypothetical protein